MKKILLGLLVIVLIGIAYVFYKELSFSPLGENDLQKLYTGYVGKPKKVCSKDFLGISSHGELFEIYLYSTKNAVINNDFPKATMWERNKITNEAILSKWKNCPLDSQALALFKFTLTSNNLDDLNCSKSFNKEILNPKNYYSYIYFSELGEEYFLLHCTDSQELYYIRRKGF